MKQEAQMIKKIKSEKDVQKHINKNRDERDRKRIKWDAEMEKHFMELLGTNKKRAERTKKN